MTATSVVPPPMSTTMFPVGSTHLHPGTDRGRHRLLDDVGSAGERPADSAASCTARCSTPVMPDGHGDDHAGLGPAPLMDPLDEEAEHLLAHVEVGDDAVLERADSLDVRGRPPEHALGIGAHRQDLAAGGCSRPPPRAR